MHVCLIIGLFFSKHTTRTHHFCGIKIKTPSSKQYHSRGDQSVYRAYTMQTGMIKINGQQDQLKYIFFYFRDRENWRPRERHR